jgi:hypothetical protein
VDTAQIICTLRNVDSFLGVFPSDLIPTSITRSGTLIVNTDSHTEKRSHWLALISKPNHTVPSILIPTTSSLMFITSNNYWDARILSGISTARNFRVSPVRSAGTTAVYLPCTWIGDILLINLTAYFTPTLLTVRSHTCSERNLDPTQTLAWRPVLHLF